MKMSNLRSLLVEYRVDFILFLYCFALISYITATANLILQKTCFPDGPPGINTLCNDTQATAQYSFLSSTRNTMHDVIPGIMVLFAGSWRDHTGLSRPLILMAHFGDLLATTVGLFSTLFWEFSTWATVLIDSLASGLLGSRALVVVACFSYITERTSNEQRATRLSVILVALMGGICIATATCGFLLTFLNYTKFYIMVLGLFVINIFFIFLCVKDNPRRNNGGGPFESLKSLKLLFMPKPNQVATWILMICSCTMSALIYSEASVSYGYFQNVLQIEPGTAGLLGSYKMLISLIMAATATPLLTKIFKLSEFTISLICIIPCAISRFLLSFAKTLTEIYICYALDMMKMVLVGILWSIITKGVKKSELGVYSSFLAFGEAVIPLALNPLYLFIFNKTLTTMPGAFFLLSGCTVVFVGILIGVSSFYFVKVEDKPDDDQLGEKAKISAQAV